MENRVKILGVLLLMSLVLIPSAQANDVEDQGIFIKTTQNGSDFALALTDGGIGFRNVEISMFSNSKNNEFKIYKDGELLNEGSFEQSGVYSEEYRFELGMSAELKIILNGQEYEYKNIKIMNKSITRDELMKKDSSRTLSMKFRTFVVQNAKAVMIGMFTTITALFLSYYVVDQRKREEIIEGF